MVLTSLSEYAMILGDARLATEQQAFLTCLRRSFISGQQRQEVVMPTTLLRLSQKYTKLPSGCWQWNGAKQPTGYGQMWNGERPEQAHRIAYRLFVGPIPDGYEVDHLCRNRSCINPAHLRIVTHRENMRCSLTVMGENARKTHCKRGHALSGHNLIITKQGTRQCRICCNMRARRYKSLRGKK